MITAITPTRDRPKAFALCCQWMAAQTSRSEVHWVVVDDGDKPIVPPAGCDYLRRKASGKLNTLPDNLVAALARRKGDGVLIFEDDDYYPPNYCETMEARLKSASASGEVVARYYNVRSRRWNIGGVPQFASLCRTAFRMECVPLFEEAIRETERAGDVSVDRRFWEIARKRGKSLDLFREPKLSVSIKGLPGRAGLGRNHGATVFPNLDPKGETLSKWLGADVAQTYWREFPV